MKRTLPLFLLLCTTTVQADIYKYVDEHGHVTLSDKPRPGAQKLTGSGPAPEKNAPRATTRTPTPAHFPRVDTATQRNRDDMRRQLLNQEMDAERQGLARALAARSNGSRPQPGEMASSPAYLDRLKRLDETVRLHEKNIEMLNKELARVR